MNIKKFINVDKIRYVLRKKETLVKLELRDAHDSITTRGSSCTDCGAAL